MTGATTTVGLDCARLPARVRQLNEIVRWTFGLSYGAGDLDVFCECADPSCFELICLPPEHYEAVHRYGDRFIVKPDHARRGFSTVHERRASFAVASQEADAANLAESLDPHPRLRPSPTAAGL